MCQSDKCESCIFLSLICPVKKKKGPHHKYAEKEIKYSQILTPINIYLNLHLIAYINVIYSFYLSFQHILICPTEYNPLLSIIKWY